MILITRDKRTCDKLEALQKRAVHIILYPLTLPYITALGYLKLESLKHRRTGADKKLFNSISQPDNFFCTTSYSCHLHVYFCIFTCSSGA